MRVRNASLTQHSPIRADSPRWRDAKKRNPRFASNPKNVYILGCADGCSISNDKQAGVFPILTEIFDRDVDRDIRTAAKRHKGLLDAGFSWTWVKENYCKRSGIKLPSQFSRLPYAREDRLYVAEGMHIIKNLADTVSDSLLGADVNQKVRNHCEARNIRPALWTAGLSHRPSEEVCVGYAFVTRCVHVLWKIRNVCATRCDHI
jgi:hypothetical protein